MLVFGDIMLDEYVWGGVDRISPEAPVPVLRVKDRTSRLGGAGNVAANLAGLGCRTILMGMLGRDRSGEQVIKHCSSVGIDSRSLHSDTFLTITKTRVMGGTQQLVRIDDESSDSVSSSDRSDLFTRFVEALAEVQAVIISDYGKGIFTHTFTRQCIAVCRDHDVPVLVDPKQEDWGAYEGADCITPNAREFSAACGRAGYGESSPERVGVEMCARFGLTSMLVTQGGDGMTLFRPAGPGRHLPTRARDVFDVSGAGDTVIATLAVGVACGCSFEDAMEAANFAAGVVVGKVGTYAVTAQDLAEVHGRSENCGVTGAVSRSYAERMLEHWRMRGLRVVFTNGCFDLLHPGHVHLLNQAKKLGDRLVVGLNSDASVQRLKGPGRPVVCEDDRAAILSALESVDLVVLFCEDTPDELIRSLKPDILVKGSDYQPHEVVGHDLVAGWGGRVELVPLFNGRSTTGIVEKIKADK